MQRSMFWDNYKGILIFFVVFGHCIFSYANNISGSLAETLYLFLYTFHMPAFVFCSGYFSKSARSRSKESLLKLFLYYVVFNTAMAAFAHFYLGSDVKLLQPYYSYWYILSLIVWRLVIGDLGRVKGVVIISLAITLAMGYWDDFSNLLSIRRTAAFFAFFAAGYLLSRDTVDGFLTKRKASMMAAGIPIVLACCGAALVAIDFFGITPDGTLMVAYSAPASIVRRAVMLVIATVAIAGMFLVVPNREIPILSKIGRNSLLIYLAHRFITIIYYKELFPYQSYSDLYVLYALVAAAVICVVFGSDRLNKMVSAPFDKAAAAIADKESVAGARIMMAGLCLFLVLLCSGAVTSAGGISSILGSYVKSIESQSLESEAASKEEKVPEEAVLSPDQKAVIDDAVKIAYVGDLILLKDQVDSAYNEASQQYDFSAMFEYATPILSEADLAIGVFEGPCAGEEKGYSTSNYGDGAPLRLNYPDEFAQAVKDSGIDLVTTANNHLLDMDLDGALRTLDVLDAVGLEHTGSYRNQEEKDSLKVIEVEGVRIAVLSYASGVNHHKVTELVEDMPYVTAFLPYNSNDNYDELVAEIEEDFAEAKASGADVIMVMAHMGTQFTTSTNEFQEKWNAMFAELGADIILGDHAHVVQPIEYIGDTVVINCPGNFANSYIAYDGDATSIVEIYVDRDSKSVIATSVVPMYTQESKPGSFRALPIYEIMTDSDLYGELWSRDHARLQEVQELVTGVMLGESIGLRDVRERYFFIDNCYYKSEEDPEAAK